MNPIFLLLFSSSWVKMRLHTENKLPKLPASALKVPGGLGGVGLGHGVGWWVGSFPLSSHSQLMLRMSDNLLLNFYLHNIKT